MHAVAVGAVDAAVAHPILQAGQQHRGAYLSTPPSSQSQRQRIHWHEIAASQGGCVHAHTNAVAACTGWYCGSDSPPWHFTAAAVVQVVLVTELCCRNPCNPSLRLCCEHCTEQHREQTLQCCRLLIGHSHCADRSCRATVAKRCTAATTCSHCQAFKSPQCCAEGV